MPPKRALLYSTFIKNEINVLKIIFSPRQGPQNSGILWTFSKNYPQKKEGFSKTYKLRKNMLPFGPAAV
jgi:hypothetical protein